MKKNICIVGETKHSNKRKEGEPHHIVLAWRKKGGFCLGQKAIDEKGNEITAIPKLLDMIRIKGQIVTNQCNGDLENDRRKEPQETCQRNQTGLYEDVKQYFSDAKIRQDIREKENHACALEKAYAQMKKRRYEMKKESGKNIDIASVVLR